MKFRLNLLRVFWLFKIKVDKNKVVFQQKCCFSILLT